MITRNPASPHSSALGFILGAALLTAQGCADDQCKSAAPSFEVKVKWEAAASVSRLAELRAHLLAAGLEKEITLEGAPLVNKGWTAFEVQVGPEGAAGFTGEVKLEALDENGAVLARGELVFEATGDACNFLTLSLQQDPCTPSCEGKTCGADDGCQGTCQTGDCSAGLSCVAGVCRCDQASCPDGCCQEDLCFPGTSDDHCGGSGGGCVDCLQASQACNAERTCIACTPQCEGLSCGAPNGCGGTCSGGACPAGQACVGGACICNPSSCPNGCCSTGQSCEAGNADPLCGKGGESCQSCATPSQVCRDQDCQACTPQCSGSCEVDDGCGGTCGCSSGNECDNQICVPIECRHCTDTGDCQTQCQLWGSSGGVCESPGSSDPGDCCDCNPISSGSNTIGFLDSVTSGEALGWSCDPDDPWESIIVHIYVGGLAGNPAATSYPVAADRFSSDEIKDICLGGDYHRYRFSIPNWQSKIGQPVYAYGISINGGNNTLLQNSPQHIQ